MEREVSTRSCSTETEKEGVGSKAPPPSPGTGPELPGMQCSAGTGASILAGSATASPPVHEHSHPSYDPFVYLASTLIYLSIRPAPDKMCTALVGSLWRLP